MAREFEELRLRDMELLLASGVEAAGQEDCGCALRSEEEAMRRSLTAASFDTPLRRG